MKLLGDYHTHTPYSHGTSSIKENVAQAEILGLKEIAITEHAYKGYNHMNPGDLQKIKAEIDEINKQSSVRVLWGVEANLMSLDGDIDISDEELKDLDLVILGFHKQSKVKISQFFKFVLPNLIRKKPTKAQIKRNTEAYIKAMDKHRVSILAHLGYGGCVVDYVRLAKEAKKRNIYIELNGKRINFSVEQFKAMADTGVKFVINSDAHDMLSVGKNHRAFNMLEKSGVSLEQIANIDKLPKFK